MKLIKKLRKLFKFKKFLKNANLLKNNITKRSTFLTSNIKTLFNHL